MSSSVGMDYLYSDHGGPIYLDGCDVILQVLENYFIIHIFVVIFSSFFT